MIWSRQLEQAENATHRLGTDDGPAEPGLRLDGGGHDEGRRQMATQMLKKTLFSAFTFFTALAVVLNVTAAAVAMKGQAWLLAGAYLLIAVALFGLLGLMHYTRAQAPYRWRDESWGQERWRELSDDSRDHLRSDLSSDYSP